MRCACPLLLFLLSLSAGSAVVRAQEQISTSTAAMPLKPVHRTGQVPSNDSIVLIALRNSPEPASCAPATGASAATKPGTLSEEAHKKAAELMNIDAQIREKTLRIAFLMRLFVTDQRPFLNDPANQNVPEAAREQRKYEQDELLWESAELARLRHSLNELKAAH